MNAYDEDPDTGATRDASEVYPLVTDDEITRWREQATAERYATLASAQAKLETELERPGMTDNASNWTDESALRQLRAGRQHVGSAVYTYGEPDTAKADSAERYLRQRLATAERYATLDSPSADYIAGYRAAGEYPLTALRRYPDPANDYQRGHNANISERMRA